MSKLQVFNGGGYVSGSHEHNHIEDKEEPLLVPGLILHDSSIDSEDEPLEVPGMHFSREYATENKSGLPLLGLDADEEDERDEPLYIPGQFRDCEDC